MFKIISRSHSCYPYAAATTGRDVGLDQSNEAAICNAVPHVDRVLRGTPDCGDPQVDPAHSTSSTLGHQRKGAHPGKNLPHVFSEEKVSLLITCSVASNMFVCTHHFEMLFSPAGMFYRTLSLRTSSRNAASLWDATLCRTPIYRTCYHVSGKSRKSTPPVTGMR